MPTLDHVLRDAYANWDDAAVLARSGTELHDRNRLDHARAVLARAIALEPHDDESWAYLAFCHLRGFEQETGRTILRDGIEATDSDHLRATLSNFTADEEEKTALRERAARSDDPVVRAELAWNRVWGGEAGALDDVRAVAAAHPTDDKVAFVLLWALGDAKRKGMAVDLRTEALPLADRRIAAHPDRIAGHWHKAQVCLLEKDWAGLLDATAAALRDFPDDETQMLFRAQALRESGDLERAAHWCARAIGAKPSFAGARTELGKTYEALGRLDLAEDVFREIPDANPAYAAGRVSLALFLARRERWDEAEAHLLEAWPRLPEWQRDGLANQPDARALLARERVRRTLDAPRG